MNKRDNLLKRHPIIPSVFFLVFAWVLLYIITGFKEAGQVESSETYTQTYTAKDPKSDETCTLTLSEESMILSIDPQKNTYTFPLVKPQITHLSESETMQTFKATSEKDKLLVIIIRDSESQETRTMIEFNGKVYFESKK